ncbi:MAG: hypothetical protein LBJ18_01465 [Rickettsiales bacterium]|jgi:hypothetical protein|nr:hypothetical protein [Rickettsiales bacterium]
MRKFSLKLIGLFAGVLALPVAAYSATGGNLTARPSVMAAAAVRQPTMAAHLLGMVSVSGGTTTTTTADTYTCDHPAPTQLTAARCITRYESCLRGENVCGEHFEQCYDKKRFNQNKIMCQDVLATCPADAIKGIYGITVSQSDDSAAANRALCDGEWKVVKRTFSPALPDLDYAGGSRIDEWVRGGSSWAAGNAVSTCKAIADSCITKACKDSPQKCFINRLLTTDESAELQNIANSIKLDETPVDNGAATDANGSSTTLFGGATTTRVDATMFDTYIGNMTWSEIEVKNYIKGQCRETVGGNKWCYIASIAPTGMPSEQDLNDPFNQDEVYQDFMIDGVGARFKAMQAKIKEWFAAQVLTSLYSCKTEMINCAVNACGQGNPVKCYGKAKDANGTTDIKTAGLGIDSSCPSIINNTQACKDIFVEKDTSGSAWAAVWTNDKTKAIADLNIQLSKMYNDQSIAKMRMQCTNSAEACVRDRCGNDFSQCFVNGAESTLNSIANGTFGKDGTISGLQAGGFSKDMARGLCILSVKKIAACQNYFDYQYAKSEGNNFNSTDSWGTGFSANNAWNGMQNLDTTKGVATCTASKTYYKTPDVGEDDKVKRDASGAIIYGGSELESEDEVCVGQEQNIFNELIAAVSSEAQQSIIQARNAAKESCRAKNGNANSLMPAYLWAKVPDEIPENYAVMGLGENRAKDDTADLWGSFCQVRVTVSGDSMIQKLFTDGYKDKNGALKKCNSDAYFSLGDTATCGSNITQDCLNAIENEIKNSTTLSASEKNWAEKNKNTVGFLSVLGGGALGGVGGNLLGDKIGDLFSSSKKVSESEAAAIANACNGAVGITPDYADTTGGANATSYTAITGTVTTAREEYDTAVAAATIANNEAASAKTDYDTAVATKIGLGAGQLPDDKYRENVNAKNNIYTDKANAAAIANNNVNLAKSKLDAANSSAGTQLQDLFKSTPTQVASGQANYRCTAGTATTAPVCTRVASNAIGTGTYTYTQADELLKNWKTTYCGNNMKTATNNNKAKMWSTVAGTVIGGIATPLMVTSSIQNGLNAKEEAKKDAAVAEWFSNVGDKIHCYIGTKRVGSYGDPIAIK